jgi:hypothetical protein
MVPQHGCGTIVLAFFPKTIFETTFRVQAAACIYELKIASNLLMPSLNSDSGAIKLSTR